SVIIVSPALATANNGNWQTASRWVRFLRTCYRVTLACSWNGQATDMMIALHARRSAGSIADFARAHPSRPLIVVLTGTDLYRDIEHDLQAQQSLRLATRLVVLQEHGMHALPAELQHKASVIRQSAPAMRSASRHERKADWRVTMAAHLREEKNPSCFMRAVTLLDLPNLRFVQLGAALDPSLGEQALRLQHERRDYRWLGNASHARARRLIRHSRLLVLPSRMEGGANVIIEAIRSGVPVL